jgi:hypothetical protein
MKVAREGKGTNLEHLSDPYACRIVVGKGSDDV